MAGSDAPSGDYRISRREGEIERLLLQGAVLAPETEALLDRIGVAVGWRCLDLGCGPRGIGPALAARVGSGGAVTGLDYDAAFVARARAGAPPNLSYVQGDAYATGLPDGGFDLVHMRFLASTAGQPQRLVAEARRLTRPGGFVAAQEADFVTLRCFPPHPAWAVLRGAFESCFPYREEDPTAYRIYRLLRAAGFAEVGCRTALTAVRADDPWVDYLPSTVESLRPAILASGRMTAEALDAALAACRAHLAEPDTIFTAFTVVQCWGRAPAG